MSAVLAGSDWWAGLLIAALGGSLGLVITGILLKLVEAASDRWRRWLLRRRIPSLLRTVQVEREISRAKLVREIEEKPCQCGLPDCGTHQLEFFDAQTTLMIEALKIKLEVEAGLRRLPDGSPIGFEFLRTRTASTPPSEQG